MIAALRHLHLSAKEAEELGLKNDEDISIKTGTDGERELVFNKVRVRVAESYKLACHIDTDEGNAAGLITCSQGEIV